MNLCSGFCIVTAYSYFNFIHMTHRTQNLKETEK